MPQDLLCTSSSFFKAAIKQEWANDEKTITYPVEDSHAVEIYVQWLYTGLLYVRNGQKTEKDNGETGLLIDGYIYGERINDRQFQNALIDGLFALMNPFPKNQFWEGRLSSDNVNRAYDELPAGSPLLKLIVDIFVMRGSEDWLGEDLDEQFLTELSRALFKHRTRSHTGPNLGSGQSGPYHHKISSEAEAVVSAQKHPFEFGNSQIPSKSPRRQSGPNHHPDQVVPEDNEQETRILCSLYSRQLGRIQC